MQETLEENEYEDAYELKQEFSELAENKREQIENEKKDNEQDKSQSDLAIEGWVEDFDKNDNFGSSTVDIEVRYVINGEEKTKTFTMDRPTSEDEFSVKNDFVRLVNFFGERRNDPSSLMHRKVWLKYHSKGDVELDIPDSLSKHDIVLHKSKRKRVNLGFSSWDSNISDSNLARTLTASVGLFGAFSAFIELSSQTDLGFAFANVALSVLLLLFGAFGFVGLFTLCQNERQEGSLIAGTIAVLIGFTLFASTGALDFVVPPQTEGFQTTLLNLTLGGVILVTSITSAYLLREPVKSVSSATGDAKDRMKKWYQEKKGVEFVEDS